jgi:two-component system nitrogen regulation response regulator NtrX
MPDEYALIGGSARMASLRREIAVAARSDAKVLITGESGVGKEIAARALHQSGIRRQRPFHAINCASLPDTLLESELFGHVRGSFSGADRDRQGILESTHRGTVLFDQIGDSSARMQGLLLRFVQSGEIQRIGDDGFGRHVDVRVIATTHRKLLEEVAAGQFRLDLYYRLNVIPLHVPPLRERIDDVPALLDHFVTKYCDRYSAPRPTIGARVMTAFMGYHWPGNVRELQNAAERLVVTGGPARLQLDGLTVQVA